MQKSLLKVSTVLFTTIFTISFITLPADGALEWTIEEVTTYRQISEGCSLALDSAGHPWISYNDDAGLEVTHFTGATWETDIVDDSGDRVSAIAFDNEGNPGIVYQDSIHSILEYAELAGNTWDISLVDKDCSGVSGLSLVTDPAGDPHVAYIDISDISSSKLKYAWRDGTTWHIETISTDCLSMETTSIQLDNTGVPCISFYNASSGALLYVHKVGTLWPAETVDSSGGHELSMKLRSDAQPGISYYLLDTLGISSLHYAYRDGAGWHSQLVDSDVNVGYSSSLAFDSSNYPRISYYDLENENLKYAYYDGTLWQIETVDSEGIVGKPTSLAIDSLGNPHICYMDLTTGNKLKYAHVASSVKLSVTPESDGVGVMVFSVLAAVGCYAVIKRKTR